MLLSICATGIDAQVAVQAGANAPISGWILTDEELQTLVQRLEKAERDSALFVEISTIRTEIDFYQERRLNACQTIYEDTRSLLNDALKDQRSFWDKVPNEVWIGIGLFAGIYAGRQ